MKNRTIIILLCFAAFIGLGTGYFLFGGSTEKMAHDLEENDQQVESREEIWTCSMHPSVRQPEPGQCPICGMDLIPLSQGASSGDPLILEMTPQAVQLANIQTIAVGQQGNGKAGTLQLSGKIKADERRVSNQVAHIPGRIEKLFVTFSGESVKKGQKLATLYSPELVNAQRELIEAIKWLDTKPQLVEAARNKLRYWKIDEATIQNVESSGKVKTSITLFADQSGIVSQRHIAVGDYVREGQVLFDLIDLSRIWVLFDAYEEDLGKIRIGDKITFTIPANPGKSYAATISFIDPVIDPQTRIATLRAELANPSGLFKPEMFVRGTLTSGKAQKTTQLTIPKTAVLWTGKRSVVYVQVPELDIPSFSFREVTLGESVGDQYQILAGLDEGERVVVNGAFVIDAAAQLNNMSSMMNRQVLVKKENRILTLPDYTESTPVLFKQQLGSVAEDYLRIVESMVASDQAEAATAADQLIKDLSKVDMSLVKGKAHLYWMDQANAIRSHSTNIAKWNDLEKQRDQFRFLSDALINTLKVFGVSDHTYFIQHCPMANHNKGANWISTDPKIRNPYFGDEMLTCGTNRDTLSPNPRGTNNQEIPSTQKNNHNH
ncbi:MAG: efflux RND transporter periplasmic adaptor subunit [Saprospiraceae bacterium]|nr:efflux RND transporter periplasmic adaptor subunit [Saprospiraceae bacterium]